jgi:16S rRNA processing protein RimM
LSRDAKRWVALARILRARGNRGEVAAVLLTDFPERLATIREVFVGDSAGNDEPRRIGLRSFRIDKNHRGQAVFHFEGCASISEAERFRDFDVLLPFEQRVALPGGHYFVSDLIGCSVFETNPASGTTSAAPRLVSSPCSPAQAPTLVGIVSDVQFTGETVSGAPFLAVDTPNGELLIPLAQDICTRIDTIARRIDVTLPDGLRTLNE